MLKAKTKQTENKYKNFFCARDFMACQWMGGRMAGQKVQKGQKGEEKRAEQQEERTTKHSKMK